MFNHPWIFSHGWLCDSARPLLILLIELMVAAIRRRK